MKGILKKIDTAGRIVIPAEVRMALGCKLGDSVLLVMNGKTLNVTKSGKECVFCGAVSVVGEYNGVSFCKNCANKIAEITE